MPRESIWKQHPGVNKHGKLSVLQEWTTVNHRQSLSRNPRSPRRSLYSQISTRKHFLSVLSFLWLCHSVPWLKESSVILFWSRKANTPSCSICLLRSFHKYLLARKQKCNTGIRFCSRLKYTGNFYESRPMAWASRIERVFKRATTRASGLGNLSGVKRTTRGGKSSVQ